MADQLKSFDPTNGKSKLLTALQSAAILAGALAEHTLTDEATITNNVSLGRNAKVTITANRILNFTNTVAGQRGILRVIQDGIGSHTLTFQRATVAADVHYPGGTPPTLTTAGNAVDVLEWYDDGAAIHLRTYSLDSKASGA
jgi:hypothetical protein